MARQTWMNNSSRWAVSRWFSSQYLVIRDPAHQFHHEKGPAGVRRARIQHPRDVGMIHHRQRLPLRLKPGDDALGVHAQLDDLERHLPAHRFLLFRQINRPAAALADFLQQLVTPHPAADLLVGQITRRISGRLP